MSRTIRKSKFGRTYVDGKKRKEPYYCNCWLCTGTGKQEVREKKELVADKYIEEVLQHYHTGV